MPSQNGELTPQELQQHFRTMSLQELSTEAAAIAQILETDPDDEDDLFKCNNPVVETLEAQVSSVEDNHNEFDPQTHEQEGAIPF